MKSVNKQIDEFFGVSKMLEKRGKEDRKTHDKPLVKDPDYLRGFNKGNSNE